MANFADITDVENFLQIDIPADKQDSINAALTEASATIRNFCYQFIERVTDETITLDVKRRTTKIYLPELPVISVSGVLYDGDTLVVDTDYKLGQHGILHRVNGKWQSGIQVLQVTYTHGYETIPDDIVFVCVRIASRIYQSGLTTEENNGILGIRSKSLGDFSVTYGSTQTGGVGEGLVGASGVRHLLNSEKEILDNYRIKRV